MVLSEYYEDTEIITQLRSFFDIDEQWEIDFNACLSQVEDYDEDYYFVKIKNRNFTIHKILGDVFEEGE